MSSRSKKLQQQIVAERLTTVCQVLSIVEREAEKMNWWQRLKLANSFLWKKNINAFFQIATANKENESESKDLQSAE
jgi:transcriptional regulator